MSCLLLADNLFNTIAYPLHTVAGDEEAVGHEAFHLADGRRGTTDFWSPITANAQHTATVTCDRVRGANCWFLDRGHNLAGVQVFVEVSQDNATWQTLASPTIPSVTSHGTIVTNANGVATEEGAWGQLVSPVGAGTYWRLRIPAMGAGLLPVVVGLWVGMAYQPANNFLMPWSEDQDDLVVKETVSEWAWRGRGPVAAPNTGTMNTKLLTDDEYDLARVTVGGHFGRGRPMWIAYDQLQADRAFLAIRPSGNLGYRYEQSWYPRQSQIQYVEHEPLRL